MPGRHGIHSVKPSCLNWCHPDGMVEDPDLDFAALYTRDRSAAQLVLFEHSFIRGKPLVFFYRVGRHRQNEIGKTYMCYKNILPFETTFPAAPNHMHGPKRTPQNIFSVKTRIITHMQTPQDPVHQAILQRAYPHTQLDPVTGSWTAVESSQHATILWTMDATAVRAVRSVLTLPNFGIYAK